MKMQEILSSLKEVGLEGFEIAPCPFDLEENPVRNSKRPGYKTCAWPECNKHEFNKAWDDFFSKTFKQERKRKEQYRLMRCSRCRKASYCSHEHQRLDWSSHKQSC